ncbi:MAG: thioredoxin family protein [Thermodesulfobacteriota bacterium]|nr:thioredoxin family protein [Thermodesulfobacteriota bacterium]
MDRGTMTSQEQERIIRWNNELSDDIQIGLIVTKDERSGQLSEFCEKLGELASRVRIVNEEGEENGIPAIKVGDGLLYHGVPLGTELEPFLHTLSLMNGKGSGIPEPVQRQLERIDLPAILRLYVSQQCPVCPTVVRQVTPLPVVNELIQLTLIDCIMFPEMAQSGGIQSVPTMVLEDRFRWTGPVQLEELVDVMVNRDPTALSASSLERMVEEGSAIELAEMMLKKEQIFPSFFDLLIHEKWPVRMGAIVTMEEIADRNTGLATQAVDPLWDRFDQAEDPIKDDILYIFGKVGSNGAVTKLKIVLNGEYSSEVKEAAREALETIEGD